MGWPGTLPGSSYQGPLAIPARLTARRQSRMLSRSIWGSTGQAVRVSTTQHEGEVLRDNLKGHRWLPTSSDNGVFKLRETI